MPLDFISASSFRSNLFQTIKDVVSKNVPVKITSKSGNVVLIPEEDYNAMQETFHLLKSPSNAKRLQDAIESLNSGSGINKDMNDLDQLVQG